MKARFAFAMCVALFNLASLERAATGADAEESRSARRYVRIGHYQCICQQGEFEARSIIDTLDLGWKLLHALPRNELKRIRPEFMDKYYPHEQ